MILVRQAVHCALMLAVVMLSLAVMYAMQGAPFLAFVQVIVYTGAVLMLFLFVVMLIGVTSAESLVETIRGQRLWAGLGGLGLAGAADRRHRARGHRQRRPADRRQRRRQPHRPGEADLHHVRLPVRSHQRPADHRRARRDGARAPRADRRPSRPSGSVARRKIDSGQVAPEPPPGVYALHNAVDMPAMLPDGSTTNRSVSKAVVQRDVQLGRDPQAGRGRRPRRRRTGSRRSGRSRPPPGGGRSQ